MKRLLLTALVSVISFAYAFSADKTLRIDYVFSGTDRTASISVSELLCLDGWWGRNVNMDRVPLKGNGQIRMEALDGTVLYVNSFSTLFQEWQATEEATRVSRSFENVFLLPMPDGPVDVTVELYGLKGETEASLTHRVDPADILIRPVTSAPDTCHLQWAGDPREKIDVVIVAEGYTPAQRSVFMDDARATVASLMRHEPFASMADCFNYTAVFLPSAESGVSVPREGIWKDTPVKSHFSTFYSDRYLTTLHLKDLHNALAGVPYEHIIILADTDTYGGGGIYNSYTLTTAHHKLFAPVVVHEFGHSFGGLADEYYYDDQFVNYYYPDVEPWEQNITTMKDFASKWKAMMGKDGVSLYEGGGYMSKGVWRGCLDCRMHTNTAAGFCPVCQRALRSMIEFQTICKSATD